MKLIQFIVMVYIIMITIGGIYVVIKTFLTDIIVVEEDMEEENEKDNVINVDFLFKDEQDELND